MRNKKLYKTRNDKFVSGVCGGLAEYFGLDATIIRLLVAGLTIFTAFFGGIVLYIVAAAIIPYEDEIYPNANRDDIVDPK